MGADNTFGETNFNPKMSSEPLEEKPFLTEALSILKRIGYDNESVTTTEKWIATEVYKLANARISSLESELKALREENERLKHWHNEKDEEADAERVSLAVAEIESEIQQATKEQENKFLSLLAENEALREERDQNKRLLTILVNQINALMEEREKMLTWITDRYDFVDGDWYIKMDLDGDDPLSHSEIVKAYTLNTENLP